MTESTITITKEKQASLNPKLISREEYRAVLRKHLLNEHFKADYKHLISYAISMFVLVSGIFFITHSNILILKVFISFLMGIALTTLTFFLHDLCHGSVVKSGKLQYIFGLTVGIFNLFPTLFWKRVHNYHHARTGNIDDPDRSYIFSEKPKNFIERISYRTRLTKEAYNKILSLLFMSFGFFFYFSNNLIGTFFPKLKDKEDGKFSNVYKLFKARDKVIVFSEIVIIILFQSFLFLEVAKANMITYMLISLIPIAVAHFTAMLYIHTNHFLSPLTGEVDDPLLNSLSLKNPKFIDTIFLNFSHHVEHHLFPYMSPAHYPKVRELLIKFYPERFKLIPMKDAIKLLMTTPRIYKDFTHLVTVDEKIVMDCPCK